LTTFPRERLTVLVLAVGAASVDWLIDGEAGLGVVVAFGLLLGAVLRRLLRIGRDSDRLRKPLRPL
jgi:hypothetical protein